ncbi:MAG: glycosyltransferase [Planctomycetales bacterium]|nr:glycosyltransferase [Planctomycetales bacterium]
MMYEPDCVGIAAIASDMCAALAEKGHEVTVYTSFPYYPQWKLAENATWRIKEETIQGVRVRRHWIFVPPNPSRIIPRLLHELSFTLSLLRSLFWGKKQEVVMVFCPLMGAVVFAVLRKLWFRDSLWVNVQDIPAEAATASGILKSGRLTWLASKVQSLIMNRGDVWSSISPAMVRQLERIKSDRIPIHCCPNWLTGSLRDQIGRVRSGKCSEGRAAPRLLYCGTIGKKQGLLELCQALSSKENEFELAIHGEGSEARTVQSWVNESQDTRYNFGSLLSELGFVDAIHNSDWFVIPQKSGVGSAFFPSKLIPCISIGTPIIAITDGVGPLAEEVNENQLGLVIPWPEVATIPQRLAEVSNDLASYKRLQENCLKRARVYDRSGAIERIESLLLNIPTVEL